MKRLILLVPMIIFLTYPATFGQGNIAFDDYFIDRTMRIDFFMTGNAREEVITLDRIYQQGVWAGNPDRLLDHFNNGAYYIKVYDIATNNLIFSRGFSCIFFEYRTTDPAHIGVKKTYHESALIPYPKRPVLFVMEVRDKLNILHPTFIQKIDPEDISIIKESAHTDDRIYQALVSGDPHYKVDLAFIAEGYTIDQWDKFKNDVDRYIEALFEYEPFQSRKDKFNIYGVFRPSAEAGVDQPTRDSFKNTVLDASFNALDTPRYMLLNNNQVLRDIAAAVPYDTLAVIANTERYGGGGIYNDYCVFAADNRRSLQTCPHEFGHSFGGLADEYFSSRVAYNDMYPKGVEPTEANITALLDPANPKWKHLMDPGLEIPTIYNDSLKGKIGVFEGAGYAAKGLYRPMNNCIMRSGSIFCRVCQNALIQVIDFYAN
ncbi:MAG: hypothetical protein AMJ79_11390 [Phycisphaerae bacterium SM23_30]|nr:MAG: hypothetical protein AMJ79_11390 [Phycisphaerae bacterium SM23_30]